MPAIPFPHLPSRRRHVYIPHPHPCQGVFSACRYTLDFIDGYYHVAIHSRASHAGGADIMTEVMIHEELDVFTYDEGEGNEEIIMSLDFFIERLVELRKIIPAGSRENARFHVRSYNDYANVYTSIKYDRSETAGERQKRQAKEAAAEARKVAHATTQETRERSLLATLLTKYPDVRETLLGTRTDNATAPRL